MSALHALSAAFAGLVRSDLMLRRTQWHAWRLRIARRKVERHRQALIKFAAMAEREKRLARERLASRGL